MISAAMLRAERVYRAELAKTTIADIGAELTDIDDGTDRSQGLRIPGNPRTQNGSLSQHKGEDHATAFRL